jgi:aryl-alcohol dehydrogenase-like predicted oxidoreductase
VESTTETAPRIAGHATAEGTKRFAERFKGRLHSDFFINIEGLTLSTLGLGTYLGETNQHDDEALAQALTEAILGGINVIDAAINYRAQRSERVIGQVLAGLIERGLIERDEIFVSTKGGFIPFDGDIPADPTGYFRDRFLKTKILAPADVVAGCHSLAPQFIDNQFEQSRHNLGLETIDLYYIHNPETQLEEVKRPEVMHRLHRAFKVLEDKVALSQLQFYGTATWEGYRVPSTSAELLKIDEVVDAASDHGAGHSFKFIQLPLNLAMPEALSERNQNGKPILQRAHELGLHVMASASIMQGRILGRLPSQFDVLAPGESDAVKALNFVRSAPGLDIALCGMKQLDHVRENLIIASIPKVDAGELAKIFS